jgi:hypothetical protein
VSNARRGEIRDPPGQVKVAVAGLGGRLDGGLGAAGTTR